MTDPPEPSILDRIRTMWEFAAVTQFFYLFFDMFGLEDFDVEIFEQELIGIRDQKLIPLTRLRLLQGLSSNRAISLENLDEFTRKQYLKRKPNANPFGEEEALILWEELDIFARIRVLRQLCTWQFINAERFRERAAAKDSEQLDWRINPVGYDAKGNTYYLLDDNRLYYSDAPVIPDDSSLRGKFRGKKRKRGARRIESEEPESPRQVNGIQVDDNAGWHLQCITLEDYNTFLMRLKKSRDVDEKELYRYLNDDVLPQLIEQEKEREQARQQKEQEFLKEQAYAARKRSTRLVQKEEERKIMREKEAESIKLQLVEEEKKREEQKLKKLEQERETRLLLREQRQRERELRIQQREEDKMRATEEAERLGKPIIKFLTKAAMSPTTAKLTTRQQALESKRGGDAIEPHKNPDESWLFDCLCGRHGTNYDDGTFTVACEKCEIWQHVDCLPDSHDRDELNKRKDVPDGTYPDYEFVCTRCRKKAKEAAKAEAVKSKEQLRKEREREINRAKYERRKLREKARKEQERRKREEELQLGMQSSPGIPDSLGNEIRVLGVPHSPRPTPERPEHTSRQPGQAYTFPDHVPSIQYVNSVKTPSSPYNNPIYVDPQNQTTLRSPQIPTHPAPRYRPSQSQDQTLSPLQYQQSPRLHQPYLTPSQHQSPRQYLPVRPAIQPYWSPYTTSSSLPNGKTFATSRPQSAPHTNGVAPQPRPIAMKPAPNNHYQPPLPTRISSPPQQQGQPRLSQPPATRLSLPKSPELQRLTSLHLAQSNSQSTLQPSRPLLLTKSPSQAADTSTVHRTNTLVPQTSLDQSVSFPHVAVPRNPSQSTQFAQASSLSDSPLYLLPTRVPDDEDVIGDSGANLDFSLNLSISTNRTDAKTEHGNTGMEIKNDPLMNGDSENSGDSNGLLQENDRTRMSFLLN